MGVSRRYDGGQPRREVPAPRKPGLPPVITIGATGPTGDAIAVAEADMGSDGGNVNVTCPDPGPRHNRRPLAFLKR